ncbi:hypothetical protein ERJ75_000379400 [Trypanosoma vivax]|nr:hypothetical protein ERJ75_000379400 [Trypanosoma vivax]
MLPAAQEFLSRASRALEATDSRRRLLDAKPRSCNSDVRQILEEEHSRWTEAARVFQRFNQEEEIPLISSTVDDMYCYLFRLCDGLLDYVREFVTGSEQGGQQKDLLQRVTLLFEGGIFHFFTVLCSKKKCASLLGGDEVKGVDLQSHVFELLIGQKHFVWMASVFTAFCDEARRACAGEASVRASSATAVRASLECLLLCSEESVLCARALMFTEPRPLVGHLLYGLRLRVATKSLMYTQATLGDAVVSLPTSQSPHQQPAAADKTKVCCAEGELDRMGNRQLAEYLLKIRRSVFSEVNLLALSVAVHVMKNASGYESPAVVTALCFIIELSGHALIPQMCGESKVPLPLSVKIAMYENILSAWSALLWCLRAASSDISQPDSAAKCNAVLQEQLKHNLAECLALLLEHCQVILCSESCLLNLITLQCAPTLLHGASAMECGTVWTHYPPTVVMQSSRFPTEFDECGGSGLPLLDPPVICKQTNDDWWYDSVVFVKVAKGLVTVMCEALGRDTESYSIRPMILGLLSRVSLNSSAAFNGLDGHCVIRLILTELRKADVQLPVSTFRQDERVAMRGDGGAGGESVVSGASLSGIVPGNGYTQERCAATSGSDSDAPNTCAHFLVGYLWRAYGELRIRPLSAEIIELIELPLLLVQWLKLITLGCSISHTLAFLFTTVVTLWRIGLTHDEEGQFFMRSKEVLLELLATLEEVDGMMNSIVCMTTASGADADTVVSDSCGGRDTMIHLIPISDECWTSSADVTSAVGGDAVALISGMLDFHLQQDARFVRIEELRLFLGFFLSTDASLHELGRACITCTLQYDVVYGAYFELLDEMESSTLQRFLLYLAPDGQQSERQTWLFKKGCVTAVVTALQRVLSTPSCVDDFPTFTRQVFFFLSAVEPSHGCGPQLATTQLVHAVTYSLPSLGDNVAHFIALAQAVLNAAVSGNRQDGENAPDRPTSGPFTMRCHDFVVKKPFFLSLLPPLLQRAHEMGIHMWEDLVSTIQLLLRSTGRIRSETLLHWAVQTRHTSLLPYLELEPATAEQMLPFIETRSGELKSFWTPVLLEAPERSEVRFGSTGGIVITVKQWPTQGFTISSHFRLDKVGSCVELFELVGSDGTASTSVAVCLVDGSSLYVQTNGKPVLIGEFHSFSGLVLQQWAQFHIVMSVTHTASVYLNATKIGSCSLRYFRPRSEVKIHVGFVNRVIPGALLSLGAVVLWDEELTTPQVEAHVAGESTPANPSKLLPCQVPRVVSKSREAVPLDDRVASFVPYEHSGSGMLMNSLSYITEERCPISANLTGGYAKPPRSWVDYRSLFVNRGGLVYLLQWVGESTSAEELQRYMEVACNCIRSISSASTLDYRTYVLLNHQLRRVSHLITHEVCDTLIHLAVVQVPALEAVHTVIINRYVFLHVFRDTELLTIMPLECALYLVNRIEHMLSAAPNRIVQHNVEIISSLQFVDSVLNSLAYANTRLPSCFWGD